YRPWLRGRPDPSCRRPDGSAWSCPRRQARRANIGCSDVPPSWRPRLFSRFRWPLIETLLIPQTAANEKRSATPAPANAVDNRNPAAPRLSEWPVGVAQWSYLNGPVAQPDRAAVS